MKRLALLLIAYCLLLSSCNYLYAKEITILYTGETHAMLYPCSCPKEPDGGVSRRATLIKQLKKSNPDTLVLDAGDFFGGGVMDEYTQNTQLDIKRTIINLKAMELMKYDALAVGDDEFNFGKEFLQENINKTNLTFLSANLKSDKASPFLIKEIAGIKIAIIGVTTLRAMDKAGGIRFIDPKVAVKQAIAELKKAGVNIIVVLGHLSEGEDLSLINYVGGIDILISGYATDKEGPASKVGSTLLLRPSWQGRRLGKLSLTVKDNKITGYKVEELRLSDKIKDAPEIISVMPRCFSDANCRKKDYLGKCLDPATLNSRCVFSEAAKVSLLIIAPKNCRVCDTEVMVNYLKAQFPGLVVSYLYFPNAKADKMIRDFGIKSLPVYFLNKDIEKEKAFANLIKNTEKKGDFYLLKPQFSGISYFLERKNLSGKLDLFLSLYDKDTKELLDMIKEFNPSIHFLAVEQENKFDAAKGNLEVEDYLRAVCVEKYFPEYFWDYIGCRAKNISSSWWEDCASGLDTNKIKNCTQCEEGKMLLRENISLNKELAVMFGPTYLLDNQEVFSSRGVPAKEEFKKLSRGKERK